MVVIVVKGLLHVKFPLFTNTLNLNGIPKQRFFENQAGK